jgi:predicted SprT family Zn-dependent metalloprotease
MFVVHELTHYISYRLVGRGERIVFSKDNKWDIPYFKSDEFIDKRN